jgi:hypothetical protein
MAVLDGFGIQNCCALGYFDAAIRSGENVDPSSSGKRLGDDDAESSFGVMYLPGVQIHLFSLNGSRSVCPLRGG